MHLTRRLTPWLLALLTIACSEQAGTPPPGAAEQPPTPTGSARTLDFPGTGAAETPPHGASGGALEWRVPDTWTVETPASSMRYAQYGVDGAGGPGVCLVFYFGPGQGGAAMANAERWAGQFVQPDGSSSLERMKVTELEDAPHPTRLVEVTGTYDGGMTMTDAPAPSQPGHMLLGAIVDGPDAPWFFKFTGPEPTVRENAAAFESMLRSIHVVD